MTAPRTASGQALIEWASNAMPENQQAIWLEHTLAIEAEAAKREPTATRSLSDSEQPSIEPERAVPSATYTEVERLDRPGNRADLTGPTDEERAEFKRGEYEAMRAIVAGDHYCPDPSLHELLPAESRVRPAAIAADSDQAEALRRALKTVLENERFDLQYSREVSRLVEAVMDHLQASSDTARPKASEGSADGE